MIVRFGYLEPWMFSLFGGEPAQVEPSALPGAGSAYAHVIIYIYIYIYMLFDLFIYIYIYIYASLSAFCARGPVRVCRFSS